MAQVYAKRMKGGTCEIGTESIDMVMVLSRGWQGIKKMILRASRPFTSISLAIFIIAQEKDSFSFEIDTMNVVSDTSIRLEIRSLVDHQASVSFRGISRIERNAARSSVFISHHSLLLSDKAKAFSLPSLEILHDDVKAGHAVSIGRMDDDQIFYLQSRGIAEDEALDMMVRGFFIPDEKVLTLPLYKKAYKDIEKIVCPPKFFHNKRERMANKI